MASSQPHIVLRQEQPRRLGQFCSESIRSQEYRERMFSFICCICRELIAMSRTPGVASFRYRFAWQEPSEVAKATY
jgi:hypothetical protein